MIAFKFSREAYTDPTAGSSEGEGVAEVGVAGVAIDPEEEYSVVSKVFKQCEKVKRVR